MAWGFGVKWRVALLVAVLLWLAGGTARGQAPAVAPFTAENALAHATFLASAIGERPAGTVGEQRAAGWLAGQFAAMGYAVRIQPFLFARPDIDPAYEEILVFFNASDEIPPLGRVVFVQNTPTALDDVDEPMSQKVFMPMIDR